MKQLIYNAQTKETTIIDVPDNEIPEVIPEPTLEEVVQDLVQTLSDKGVIP